MRATRPRESPLTIRLRRDEHALIKAVAERYALTVVDYLRCATLAYARAGLDPSPVAPRDPPPKAK